MPELPEVEITRRGLQASLTGARILDVRLGKSLRWPLGLAPQALVGTCVACLDRRGKYLLCWLQPQGLLLWHLGMSGSLGVHAADSLAGPHDHFNVLTDRGWLRLHDPRRFGAVVHVSGLDDPLARKLLDHLGPEPWNEAGQPFDVGAFHAALARSRLPIKPFLLQGQAVVGVGNIYASEALFRARIHPLTPARRIGPARALRLRDAICEVLGQSLANGGSTLRDFRDAHGREGLFQTLAQVYGREGQPCMSCAQPIRRVSQGQRSTYFCANCQHP